MLFETLKYGIFFYFTLSDTVTSGSLESSFSFLSFLFGLFGFCLLGVFVYFVLGFFPPEVKPDKTKILQQN